MIHQIANADECCHQSRGHNQSVECPQQAFALGDKMAEQHHGNHNASCATMTGQSSLPYFEDFARVLLVDIPFIEEDMSQSGANDGGQNDVDEQAAQPSLGCPLVLEDAGHDLIAHVEADGKHQPVPPHCQRAIDQVWTHRPCYIVQHVVYCFATIVAAKVVIFLDFRR